MDRAEPLADLTDGLEPQATVDRLAGPGRRLEHGDPHVNRACHRSARHGRHPAASRAGAHPPFRPRVPVHDCGRTLSLACASLSSPAALLRQEGAHDAPNLGHALPPRPLSSRLSTSTRSKRSRTVATLVSNSRRSPSDRQGSPGWTPPGVVDHHQHAKEVNLTRPVRRLWPSSSPSFPSSSASGGEPSD
jgi:hypothetical protein